MKADTGCLIAEQLDLIYVYTYSYILRNIYNGHDVGVQGGIYNFVYKTKYELFSFIFIKYTKNQ